MNEFNLKNEDSFTSIHQSLEINFSKINELCLQNEMFVKLKTLFLIIGIFSFVSSSIFLMMLYFLFNGNFGFKEFVNEPISFLYLGFSLLFGLLGLSFFLIRSKIFSKKIINNKITINQIKGGKI